MRRLRRALVGLALLFTGLVALSVGFKLFGLWRVETARAAFEREVGPLDPASYASPAVRAEENMVAALRELAPAVAPRDAELAKAQSALYDDPSTPLGAAHLARLRERLESSAAVLARVHAAVALPHAVLVSASLREPEVSSRYFPQLLVISNLLAAEVIVALADHDEPRAVRALEALARLVRAWRSASGGLHLDLIARADEARLLQAVRRYVASGQRMELSDRVRIACEAAEVADSFPRTLASEGAWVWGHATEDSRLRSRTTASQRALALLLPVTMRDAEAGTLDAHRETRSLVDRTYVEWRASHGDPDLATPPARGISTPYSYIRRSVGDLSRRALRSEQILRDARVLARASLRLRDRLERGDPARSDLLAPGHRSAVSGAALVVEESPEGGYVLSFAGSQEALEPLLQASDDHSVERSFQLLRWRVVVPKAETE